MDIRVEIDNLLTEWSLEYKTSKPNWEFIYGLKLLYDGSSKTISIPEEYLHLYELGKENDIRPVLKYYLAHEFAHHIYNEWGIKFMDREGYMDKEKEERAAHAWAKDVTGCDRETLLLTLREISPKLYYQMESYPVA